MYQIKHIKDHLSPYKRPPGAPIKDQQKIARLCIKADIVPPVHATISAILYGQD